MSIGQITRQSAHWPAMAPLCYEPSSRLSMARFRPSTRPPRFSRRANRRQPRGASVFAANASPSTEQSQEPKKTLRLPDGQLIQRMNNIPHTRELRQCFYSETSSAVAAAMAAGRKRISLRCIIPELNPELDVYRVGTMLELVRILATQLAVDGRRVKVCVQQSLGQGVFQGTPLSLSGVMRIMKAMEWGEAGDFISLGNLGANEVPSADVFILIAPQNISGASVLPLIEQMAAAAEREGKTMITVNSRLTDVPSSAGVMGVRGRQERLDFVATFEPAFHFRLLFLGASMYPVMGALKYSYGGPWEVYKRVDIVSESGQKYEEYQLIGEFEKEPNSSRITDCFQAARKANR